jgi:glycosyltransferase involved in cell wall biosynthesis
MMRLGLVGPEPPPAGGMANQTRQLASLLAAEGLEVTVVRTNAPYRPALLARVRGLRALLRLLPYLRTLARVSRRIDVMHVMANSGWAWFLFAAPAIRAAARRAVPVVVNYRGGLAREFLAKSARRVRGSLERASAIVVPTGFLQEVFAQHGITARVIPNVVDLSVFQPAIPARPTGHHVVVTRNLEPVYGIDTAVRAAAILVREFPDLAVSIAGEGGERPALERLCAELGVTQTVRFTGPLDVPGIVSLYHEADLALNPSRADNTPNALLEAAACGVPIVSTDVGGVRYLVEHGRSAWLVPAEDPALMAAGVARVLRDAALRGVLRNNALALARSCSWAVVRQQWLELYAALARDRRRSSAAVSRR